MTDVTAPSPRRRWLPVVVWTATIWAAIPFMRALERVFTHFLPKQAIGWFVVAAIVVAAGAATVAVRRARGRLDMVTLVTLAISASVLVAWTAHLWREPAEAFHFVQYGVLGALLFRAWHPVRPDLSAHLAAAAAGLLLGTVDEVLQWLTPARFWDVRDILINGSAAALVQPALWRLAPPRQPLRRARLSLPLTLAAIELALFAVCFSATPERLVRIAERAPSLAFLTRTTNTMAEYGHVHTVPGVGTFKSRLTVEDLSREDRTRAATAASVLDRYPSDRYAAFLRDVNPGVDAFVYEARVHIFSRNANWLQARALPAGSAERRDRMTVAYREQQILERYFGHTLAASTYAPPPELVAQARAEMEPNAEFTSRAAAHLIVRVSEPTLRRLLLGGAAMLLVTAVLLRRRTGGVATDGDPE